MKVEQPMPDALAGKMRVLHDTLRGMRSVLVAFSGGLDSTFLVAVAHQTLGGQVLAVTATSPTYPDREFREAADLARQLGVRHHVVASNELDIPGFSDNPPERCYFCKKELFALLKRTAEERGLEWVLDGSNTDDEADFRPGRRAARELGVRSPLREAGFSKEDIRAVSRIMGLPTAEKAPFACLASRFPYGTAITMDKLRQVEGVEAFLFSQGFRTFRARHHGTVVRLEIAPADMPRLLEPDRRAACVRCAREQGFAYVTLDLEGYRTGSMNETLPSA